MIEHKSQNTASKGLNIHKISLDYIHSNLVKIPLIGDEAIRQSLFEIKYKIDLINDETDKYAFFFYKAFDVASLEINAQAINDNIGGAFGGSI